MIEIKNLTEEYPIFSSLRSKWVLRIDFNILQISKGVILLDNFSSIYLFYSCKCRELKNTVFQKYF